MPHRTVRTGDGTLSGNLRATWRIVEWLCFALLLAGFAPVSQAQSVSFSQLGSTAAGCGVTTGADGAMWVISGVGSIFRITPAGVVTSYKLTMPNKLSCFITAGPDGAVWFTMGPGMAYTDPPLVGRITTAGVITTYPVSVAAGEVTGITAGPDGALWFLEYFTGIGRITPAGKLTEYPLPKAVSHPLSITTGSDGALWFTEEGGKRIGRITTTGVITEYTLTNAPTHITAGPDGALWFTERGANRIGRITTAGVITEFGTTTYNSGPVGITVGPDGALWFAETSGKNIGRITTDGVVSEYPVPSDTPYAITTGPDGALWYTTQSAYVGRAVIDVTAGSLPHVASGGSWKTTIVLANTGAASAGAILNFFDDKGAPWILPFTSPQLPGSLQLSSITLPMLPYGLIVIETELPASQPTQTGWTQVLASSTVSASAVFGWNQSAGLQEAVVPLETRNGSYVLPFDNKDFATGVAIANLAPIPVGIPVVVRDELGIQLGTDTIQLPAHGHTSFVLTDASQSAVIAKQTASRRGTLEFGRPPSGQISVLGIRANSTGAFTSIPVALK